MPSLRPPSGRLASLAVVVIVAGFAACRSTAPAVDEANAASEHEGYKNTIKWSTASELDNFGFYVYRSGSEDGPFERLHPDPIEGGGTTDSPRYYAFVDDTIDPCATYYYYVESLSMSGVRERFTPIRKAPPKVSPESRAGSKVCRDTSES